MSTHLLPTPPTHPPYPRLPRYNPLSLRDLLRVIRNKKNHFRELPPDVQQLLGEPPDMFYRYFSQRFPKLLMFAFEFACAHCAGESAFRDYLPREDRKSVV